MQAQSDAKTRCNTHHIADGPVAAAKSQGMTCIYTYLSGSLYVCILQCVLLYSLLYSSRALRLRSMALRGTCIISWCREQGTLTTLTADGACQITAAMHSKPAKMGDTWRRLMEWHSLRTLLPACFHHTSLFPATATCIHMPGKPAGLPQHYYPSITRFEMSSFTRTSKLGVAI